MVAFRPIVFRLYLIWFLGLICVVGAWYYCDNKVLQKHCNTFSPMPNGEPTYHIQCKPEQVTPSEGTYFGHYPMTKHLRALILDWHNRYRDEIAGGTVDNTKGKLYPKASRMRELLWDDELAYLSYLHSKQCAGKHSKCHNTNRFLDPGQNIGYKGTSGTIIGAFDIVNVTMVYFFNEKNTVDNPAAVVDEMTSAHTAAAGHFTVIINDRVSFVGCAVSHCLNNSNKYSAGRLNPVGWFLLCHYEASNLYGTPVYITAEGKQKTATECSDWGTAPSTRYKNLCQNSGRVFTFLEAYKPSKSKQREMDAADN